MSHPKLILLIFFSVAIVSSGLAFYTADRMNPSPTLTTAQIGGGVLPNTNNGKPCEPAKPPSEAGACGANAFLQLIQNIIKILLQYTLILAPLLIAAGGIVILTAGGSAERIGSGKSMITAAIWGIVIALGSYLIISLIFKALDVNTRLFPTSVPFN